MISTISTNIFIFKATGKLSYILIPIILSAFLLKLNYIKGYNLRKLLNIFLIGGRV